MLVLSRHSNEAIRLIDGDREIWITVRSIDKGQVKLGIDAPEDVAIVREELLPDSDKETPCSK